MEFFLALADNYMDCKMHTPVETYLAPQIFRQLKIDSLTIQLVEQYHPVDWNGIMINQKMKQMNASSSPMYPIIFSPHDYLC